MLKMSQLIRSTLLILINAAYDGLQFLRQMACSHSALAAENLFLRKQLAFYQEHKIRPRRLSNAARFSLLLCARLFDWQAALAIVKPDTFLRWQREAYKRFWQWKSRAGGPRSPEKSPAYCRHGEGKSHLVQQLMMGSTSDHICRAECASSGC